MRTFGSDVASSVASALTMPVVDLRCWSDHHQLPIRTKPRDRIHQVYVHALVDHAEEADTRTRYDALVRRIGRRRSCLREVPDIDAAGERMDVGMPVALRLI